MDYQAQSFGVAKYAVSTNKLCGKKTHTNETIGVAIGGPRIATKS